MTTPLFFLGGFLLYVWLAFMETSQPAALPWHGPTVLLAFLTGVAVFANSQLRSPLSRIRWAGGLAALLWFLNPWTMRPMAFQEMDSLWFAWLVGIWTWLWIETSSWSTFMRGGVLTFGGVIILRFHTGGGLLLFAAMIPWALWNRRPLYSLIVVGAVAGVSLFLYWSLILLHGWWNGED